VSLARGEIVLLAFYAGRSGREDRPKQLPTLFWVLTILPADRLVVNVVLQHLLANGRRERLPLLDPDGESFR